MKYINVFKAELIKYLSESKTYFPDHIVNIVVTYILFTGFFLGFKSNNIITDSYYIGFIYWFFASNIISEASVSISFEKQVGTLEQLISKPISLGVLLISKTLAWLLIAILKSIILIFILILTLPIKISFSFLLIPVFIITVIGLLGISLLLAGLTIRYTKTASFESIISYILLFFTGSIINLDNIPHIFVILTKFLPLAPGINISKNIIDSMPISSSEIILFLVNNFMYFFIGLYIFNKIYVHGKTNGILSEY